MFQKLFIGRIKVLFGMVMVSWNLLQVRVANALDVQKPSIMQGGGDTSKLDAAGTSIIEFVLNLVYTLGAVSLVIGLLLCLPIVGKTSLGLNAVKGSVLVLVVVGAVDVIFGVIGGLW